MKRYVIEISDAAERTLIDYTERHNHFAQRHGGLPATREQVLAAVAIHTMEQALKPERARKAVAS